MQPVHASGDRAERVCPVEAPTRPRVVDFLLMFVGFGISALLAELSGVIVVGDESSSVWLLAVQRILPTLLFLPVGVLLLWPVFYISQKVLGRQQPLTLAEWLWGLAWLGTLALSGWIVFKATGQAPEFLNSKNFKDTVVLIYGIVMLAMGGIAVLLFLTGLLARWATPWTHTFALALLVWPALPLAFLVHLGLKLD
jgi:hypothetical protein